MYYYMETTTAGIIIRLEIYTICYFTDDFRVYLEYGLI